MNLEKGHGMKVKQVNKERAAAENIEITCRITHHGATIEKRFCKPVVMIGSDSSCDIQIGGPTIHKQHAVLTARDGKLFVEILNGRPFTPAESQVFSFELHAEDALSMGPVQLRASLSQNSNKKAHGFSFENIQTRSTDEAKLTHTPPISDLEEAGSFIDPIEDLEADLDAQSRSAIITDIDLSPIPIQAPSVAEELTQKESNEDTQVESKESEEGESLEKELLHAISAQDKKAAVTSPSWRKEKPEELKAKTKPRKNDVSKAQACEELHTREDEDDDEDEESRNFVEPYSLLEKLLKRPSAQTINPRSESCALEVIHYRRHELLSLKQLRKKSSLTIDLPINDGAGNKRFQQHTLCHLGKNGKASVRVTPQMKGIICIDAIERDIQASAVPCRSLFNWASVKSASINPNEFVKLQVEDSAFLIRYTMLPKPPKMETVWKPNPTTIKVAASSVALHLLLGMIISLYFVLFGGPKDEIVNANIDRFVKLELKNVDIPKELNKPEPPKPESKDVKKIKASKPDKQLAKIKQSKLTATAKAGAKSMALLGKLGAISSGARMSGAKLASAVTNVQAVRALGGVKTFNLSGFIAKLPTRNAQVVRVASLNIKGGLGISDASFGTGLDRNSLNGGRRIRAQTIQAIQMMEEEESQVIGSLSREEIAKVVEAHIAAIRYCYERELMQNPSLQGKVIAKWVIAANGRVDSSAIQSSTLNNSRTNSCLVSEIKTWTFPKPRGGGLVRVVFPFQFAPASF